MKKIMIVDDEKVSLMMTNHILSTQYMTICASSGMEAIGLYRREHPDMILSDLRMPGMSGYVLQQTLEEQYHKKIPFMFMTADTADETESEGFANGALDFIRKPFRADVLLKRVGNILNTVEQIQGLKKAAGTDPMTGLLNKASSQDEIGAMCQTSQGVFMMIDLDSFKLVNDLYGHSMGDKILIRFAEIIQSAVRSTDITGRMGGDEFIAYCQNIKDETVIAQKSAYINEQLLISAREYMGKDMSIPLGASIGCAFAPEEGTDFLTLYKKADKALYNVKQNGKHGYKIYRKAQNTHAKDDAVSTDLSNTLRILHERNQTPGAFSLPLEQFRTIFQFLARFTSNYQKEVWILNFKITSDDSSEHAAESATEQFFSVLRSSLRQSDVITQNGKNQFLVLLLETSISNIDFVIKRIMENRAKSNDGDSYQVTYEMDVLK